MRGISGFMKIRSHMVLTTLIVTLLATCVTGCREKFHADPPALKGEQLITATALRHHMNEQASSNDYDYNYIFISVYGKDPDRDFMDFFSDIFPEVLPGSKMNDSPYDFENLPQTSGIWIHFDVVDFTQLSGQEAWVTCRSFEYDKENPSVKYRMELVNGRWKATSIVSIEEGRILQ
jgi:hypothetical protein